MEVLIKAWGDVVGKLKDDNGPVLFSLAPSNPLNFSPIKLKDKGRTYNFSDKDYLSGMPGLIKDSLPGVYGKEFLDDFFMKHFSFTPSYLETLQFLGDNTMGALTFEPKMKRVEPRKNAILDAKELYIETKKALLGESELSISEVIAMSNSAASGARPKAIVGYNPKTQKIYVGSKFETMPEGFIHSMIKFDNLIFKGTFEGPDKNVHTKGEYIYSLLAKEAGINMAKTYLLELDGHSHFVTERFDISEEKNGELERKHMHSLSGIMHQNPAETTFDYTNLYRVGDRLNIPHSDKEQFFKIMLFNLIFGNKDDHTRNFSYLMDKNGKWRGAAAYDLTFSVSREHQMRFNAKRSSDLKVVDIKKMADEYNIKNSSEIIEQMIDIKHTRLPVLAKEHGLENWAEKVIKVTEKTLVE